MITGDTIAAFSSGISPAARIVLRISGPESFAIVRSFSEEYKSVAGWTNRRLLKFANLECPVSVYTFKSPNSYTGEDQVELHLPGSPVLAQFCFDAVLRAGARLAEPGEFTARAYFSGKLDLTEAEGVAATISASSDGELATARQLLAGELARRLRPVMDLIAETLALVEIGIDFSEEDVTFLPRDEIVRRANEIDQTLRNLINDNSRFETLAHQPRMVLIGRPNAGKSTLINALAKEQRAIVSNVSGTTRDVLSTTVELEHGFITLVDVAGLEDSNTTSTEIDQQMQQRASRELEAADHVLIVRDCTDVRDQLKITRRNDLVICTKADLSPSTSLTRAGGVLVSVRDNVGLDKLREALDRLAFGTASPGGGVALNRRHIANIGDARLAVARAIDRVVDNSAELIALELREALDALGQILGLMTPDDVLGKIFSAFCIGK